MESDSSNTEQEQHNPMDERRVIQDRRAGNDRRNLIRYEAGRRKNHGRRQEDKDPWKESLEFD
ncbi:hypothetical protein [Amphritea japonica]|uniref:hypothetical protein n=1 Tax=Amphritea japonica TaxID=452627 RepID=UPI00036B7610|nr:hypothetical protein [Amphritea japonica]